MLPRLFLLFLFIPFVEIVILIKMAMWLGFWETVLIQIGTAFLGATLAKHEGLRVWTRIQTELAAGRMPSEDMIDGLMIFAGGIVLFTPGLLSDLCGILLLIPWTRQFFKGWVEKKFAKMKESGETGVRWVLIE